MRITIERESLILVDLALLNCNLISNVFPLLFDLDPRANSMLCYIYCLRVTSRLLYSLIKSFFSKTFTNAEGGPFEIAAETNLNLLPNINNFHNFALSKELSITFFPNLWQSFSPTSKYV